MADDNKEPRKPFDDALGSISKGFGKVFKAASNAGKELKTEIGKGGIAKSFEDGGKEILRAAGNVSKQLGHGLHALGEKISSQADKDSPAETPAGDGPKEEAKAEKPAPREYPQTRAEFEERYGKVAGDWPRSAYDFEKRFGMPPGDKAVGPTAKDPGFRIATDDDPK